MLTARGGQLSLDADAGGWCHVTLTLTGGLPVVLGAEVRELVVQRLIFGLSAPLTADPVWLFSLAERHGAVYAAEVGGLRRLLFQRGDAEWLGHLDFDEADRQRWLAILLR